MIAMSSPVIESNSKMVARWVGIPAAALLANTVTSFAPRAGGSSIRAGMTAKAAFCRPTSTTVRSGCRALRAENCWSAGRIVAMRSSIDSTIRTSSSESSSGISSGARDSDEIMTCVRDSEADREAVLARVRAAHHHTVLLIEQDALEAAEHPYLRD